MYFHMFYDTHTRISLHIPISALPQLRLAWHDMTYQYFVFFLYTVVCPHTWCQEADKRDYGTDWFCKCGEINHRSRKKCGSSGWGSKHQVKFSLTCCPISFTYPHNGDRHMGSFGIWLCMCINKCLLFHGSRMHAKVSAFCFQYICYASQQTCALLLYGPLSAWQPNHKLKTWLSSCMCSLAYSATQ